MTNPHHALLYFVAETTDTPFDLAAIAAESEVTEMRAEKFSIGDVRTLIDTAYGRPFEKGSRTIIVRALDIGLEAQHALLKVLEEPPLTTRLIFILKQGCTLLPTLLSRVAIVTADETESSQTTAASLFIDFLTAPYATRLEQIGSLTKAKDTEGLEALEQGLRHLLVHDRGYGTEIKTRLIWCLTNLRLHGASKKMLWEEIALTLQVENPKRG